MEVYFDFKVCNTLMKQQEPADKEWDRLADNLAVCLADLSEDEFLILSSKRANYFVQFAAQGQFGMRMKQPATCT